MKKAVAFLLCCVLTLSLMACQTTGKPEGTGKPEEGSTDGGEYAYIPEWMTVEIPTETGMMYTSLLAGEQLYYSWGDMVGEDYYGYVGARNLLEQAEPTQVQQGNGTVNSLFTDAEGALWCIRYDFRETKAWFAEKVNFEGVTSESIDITPHVGEMGTVQKAGMDKNGNLYLLLMNTEQLGVYNLKVISKEGECINEIPEMDYMYSLVTAPEKGMLYSDMNQCASMILPESKSKTAMEKITNSRGTLTLSKEEDGNLLFVQDSFLMHYDWESDTVNQILDFTESSIVTEQIQGMNTLSDGRIAVLIRDWQVENTLEIAFLTKVPASEVPQKQTLYLGTLLSMNSGDLNEAIMNFNKRNSEYEIELVCYGESDWNAAVQKMNQEIISGNGPDLIDLRFMSEELGTYLEKGILEDLNPYLNNSEVIQREDFLPNLLDSYTMDGTLYTIPTAFQISTLIGKSSEVGEEIGWTQKEFMDYAMKQPEGTRLLGNECKGVVLQYLLGKDAENFIDWNTGTGAFDSQEFQSYLEFANRYPAEFSSIPYEEIPQMLNKGSLKLCEARLLCVEDWQEYCNYYFNAPITCIGYPTSDGSGGSYFEGSGVMLGINSQSEYKDVAWNFMESLLTKSAQMKKDAVSAQGFPSRTDALEAYFAECMIPNYEYDENGEIKTDANGEPVQAPKLTVSETAPDGTVIETHYYAATRQEVDMMKAVIASIEKNSWSNWEILDIIIDEANPYFYGQKSLQEVSDNIQGRMNIYISERK